VILKLIVEIKLFKDILLFMGASLNPPEIAIVTEYLPKGNLQNLLKDSSQELDWDRRYKMAADVAR
jgi:hypothetical protein